MPIYDFVCKNCANRFDLLVSYDWRKAGAACPACKSNDLEKEVSLVGGFQTGTKIQMLGGDNSSCSSCSTGSCSTCH